FIVLRLHQVELARQRDVVRQRGLARRQRVVPVDPELRPVDRALELEADALLAVRIGDRVDDRALQLDGLRLALDRQVAIDRDVAAGAGDVGRAEGDLRRTL